MDSALLFQLLDDPTAHSQHPQYPRPSSSLFPAAGNFSLFISRAPFPRDAPGGFQAAKCPLRSESPLLPRGDPGSPAEHSLEQTLVIPCSSDPGDPGAQTRRPEGHRGYLYPYPHMYFFFPFFFGNSGFKRDLNSHFWGFWSQSPLVFLPLLSYLGFFGFVDLGWRLEGPQDLARDRGSSHGISGKGFPPQTFPQAPSFGTGGILPNQPPRRGHTIPVLQDLGSSDTGMCLKVTQTGKVGI